MSRTIFRIFSIICIKQLSDIYMAADTSRCHHIHTVYPAMSKLWLAWWPVGLYAVHLAAQPAYAICPSAQQNCARDWRRGQRENYMRFYTALCRIRQIDIGQGRQEKSPFSQGETGLCRTSLDQAVFIRGARGGTRTRTVLPPSGPKPGASTNFATRAVLLNCRAGGSQA